ncbi:hypothetical protein AMTRI_Chr03g144690 [Amborella trichopoda]
MVMATKLLPLPNCRKSILFPNANMAISRDCIVDHLHMTGFDCGRRLFPCYCSVATTLPSLLKSPRIYMLQKMGYSQLGALYKNHPVSGSIKKCYTGMSLQKTQIPRSTKMYVLKSRLKSTLLSHDISCMVGLAPGMQLCIHKTGVCLRMLKISSKTAVSLQRWGGEGCTSPKAQEMTF